MITPDTPYYVSRDRVVRATPKSFQTYMTERFGEDDEAKPVDDVEGYAVLTEAGGYEWLSKDRFEEAYTKDGELRISEAIYAMRHGFSVTFGDMAPSTYVLHEDGKITRQLTDDDGRCSNSELDVDHDYRIVPELFLYKAFRIHKKHER